VIPASGQPWLCEVKGGVEIAIYLQPGAKATEVAGAHDGALKLRVHAPPVDGKANAAVIAFLALKLDVAKSQIELICGNKNRRKRLRVLGVSAGFVQEKLLAT
jgi:uncharacterized protein (TIGR00251 family)